MSIKDILVYLDDSRGYEDRIKDAFDISRVHGSYLTGASLATMKPVHAKSKDQQVLIRMSDQQAHKIADDFTIKATAVGIDTESIVIPGGASSSALKMAKYARNADLVILGQPDPSRDNYARLQEFSQTVILHSGRPILFMPYIGTRRVGYKTTMFAWDGSPAASRAIHDSFPLLAETKEVIILIVESKKLKEAKKNLFENRLIAHLGRHDINARVLRVDPGTNDVPTTILNKIDEYDIDLLVIGGSGTPTFKQKIFGSVPATILKTMLVAVLMSH